MSDPIRPESDVGEEHRILGRRAYRLKGHAGVIAFPIDDALGRDLAMLVEGETSGRPLEDVLAEFGRSRSAYYAKLRRLRGILRLPMPPNATRHFETWLMN